MSGRIMGIDVGRVRVGVAFCDPLGISCAPFDVFPRAQGRAERSILKLIDENSVKLVVVGMPYNQSGEVTVQCEMVQHFISRLERRVPSDVKIVCQDEYLSSEEAIQRMVERGIDVQKHPVDAVAALVILEDYLKENRVETNL